MAGLGLTAVGEGVPTPAQDTSIVQAVQPAPDAASIQSALGLGDAPAEIQAPPGGSLGLTSVGGQAVPPPIAPPAPPGPARAAPPAGLQPPAPPGPSGGGMAYETTTTRTESSSGLDEAAQKRAGARLDATGEAQRKAVDDEAAARQARAEYEVRATEAALDAAAQRRREAAAEAALNDHTTAEVDRRMQAASDWKPDRAAFFKGNNGAARGILAAIAVIAGGWMQGRGQTSTNQFLPFIMKMIDDDVDDQVRSNSANIQFLREQKGDLKAAAAELKKRQLMLVDSELQAKAAASAAKDPSAAAALEAYKSQSAAAQAKWDAEQRTALERTVNRQVSRVTSPAAMAAPAAAAAPKERSEAQAKAQSANDAVNALGEKAGLIRDANGKWVVGKGPLPPGMLEQLPFIGRFFGNEVTSAADAAVEAYGRMQSGGVIGADERPAFEKQLGKDTFTRQELANRLNAADVNIKAKLREQDAVAQEQSVNIPYQRIR